MTNDLVAGPPRWVPVVVWSIALTLAAVGIVVAIVTSSVWPLVAFAGLAIPMLPIGGRRFGASAAGRG